MYWPSPSCLQAEWWICTMCGKQLLFRHKHRHIRDVHLRHQPHVCSVCDKRFSQASNLRRHMLSHRTMAGEQGHLSGQWAQWELMHCPGPRFNIKMSSYQYRKSHCGDKTVVRSSYLHNGISYTGKMSSLYWIRALNDFNSTNRLTDGTKITG